MLEAPEETDGCFDCLAELTSLISAQRAQLEQLDRAKGGAEAELQSLLIGQEEEQEALRQAALSKVWQVQLSPQVCAAVNADLSPVQEMLPCPPLPLEIHRVN